MAVVSKFSNSIIQFWVKLQLGQTVFKNGQISAKRHFNITVKVGGERGLVWLSIDSCLGSR